MTDVEELVEKLEKVDGKGKDEEEEEIRRRQVDEMEKEGERPCVFKSISPVRSFPPIILAPWMNGR